MIERLDIKTSTSAALKVYKPASAHVACIAYGITPSGEINLIASRRKTFEPGCPQVRATVRTKIIGSMCPTTAYPRKHIHGVFVEKILKKRKALVQDLIHPNYFEDVGVAVVNNNETSRREHLLLFLSLDVSHLSERDLVHWHSEVPIKGTKKKTVVYPPQFISIAQMIGYLKGIESAKPAFHALLLVLRKLSVGPSGESVRRRYQDTLDLYADLFEKHYTVTE